MKTSLSVQLLWFCDLVSELMKDILQFLSMKLATVNPELNFDVDRILSKDVSEGLNLLGPFSIF